MAKGAEVRDDRITIRIPHRLRVELEREALAEMRSVSDVILLAVMAHLGDRKPRRGGR